MEDPQKDKDTPTWSLLPKPRRERHTGESSQAPEPGNRPMGSTRHPQESRYGSVEPRGQGDFTAGSFQSTGTSFHPAGAREEEQYHRAPDGQSRPNQPRGNVRMVGGIPIPKQSLPVNPSRPNQPRPRDPYQRPPDYSSHQPPPGYSSHQQPPVQQYAPPPLHQPPVQQYAPPPLHQPPVQQYAPPPLHQPPVQQYAPPPLHQPPVQQYAPPPLHQPPVQQYAPPPLHQPPVQQYAPPPLHQPPVQQPPLFVQPQQYQLVNVESFPRGSSYTQYSCDVTNCYRNQLFISAMFLVCGVLCLNVSVLPCAIFACFYAIKAADANKEKRPSDAQKYHKRAKVWNIVLLICSGVELLLAFSSIIALSSVYRNYQNGV